MNNDLEQFIKEQSQNYGTKWLEVFQALVDSLYNSRGKSLDKVAIDQAAAQIIEKELIGRLVLGTEKLTAQRGDEYS